MTATTAYILFLRTTACCRVMRRYLPIPIVVCRSPRKRPCVRALKNGLHQRSAPRSNHWRPRRRCPAFGPAPGIAHPGVERSQRFWDRLPRPPTPWAAARSAGADRTGSASKAPLKPLHPLPTARGGKAGVLEQIVAPQHNGDDVRLLTADHLGKRFNVPTVPGDGSSILSRVENVPALCLKQGSPPDAFRVSPAKAGPGIVPIGIGIPIA